MDINIMPWQIWTLLGFVALLGLAAVVLAIFKGEGFEFGCDPDKYDGPKTRGAHHIGKVSVIEYYFSETEEFSQQELDAVYAEKCPECGYHPIVVKDIKESRIETRGKDSARVEHWWKAYTCAGCMWQKIQYWGNESCGPL
jgi:hypothetical protein